MTGCCVDYLFYKHAFPMLLGEKHKPKELEAIYKEMAQRRIFCKQQLPKLKPNEHYRFVGLTVERADKVIVEFVDNEPKSLVDKYREAGVKVQFPRAPCMILCDESGNHVLALIDKCLRSCELTA